MKTATQFFEPTATTEAISIRDFYAAFALLACNNSHQLPQKIAASAFALADAMIAERERER